VATYHYSPGVHLPQLSCRPTPSSPPPPPPTATSGSRTSCCIGARGWVRGPHGPWAPSLGAHNRWSVPGAPAGGRHVCCKTLPASHFSSSSATARRRPPFALHARSSNPPGPPLDRAASHRRRPGAECGVWGVFVCLLFKKCSRAVLYCSERSALFRQQAITDYLYY
jgi:hypothetical protein